MNIQNYFPICCLENTQKYFPICRVWPIALVPKADGHNLYGSSDEYRGNCFDYLPAME